MNIVQQNLKKKIKKDIIISLLTYCIIEVHPLKI